MEKQLIQIASISIINTVSVNVFNNSRVPEYYIFQGEFPVYSNTWLDVVSIKGNTHVLRIYWNSSQRTLIKWRVYIQVKMLYCRSSENSFQEIKNIKRVMFAVATHHVADVYSFWTRSTILFKCVQIFFSVLTFSRFDISPLLYLIPVNHTFQAEHSRLLYPTLLHKIQHRNY